jgi:hypothetical protein
MRYMPSLRVFYFHSEVCNVISLKTDTRITDVIGGIESQPKCYVLFNKVLVLKY